ncbi:MAG: hypothetical protein Q9207_001958 [Kuettlingeria erythrocarpa]
MEFPTPIEILRTGIDSTTTGVDDPSSSVPNAVIGDIIRPLIIFATGALSYNYLAKPDQTVLKAIEDVHEIIDAHHKSMEARHEAVMAEIGRIKQDIGDIKADGHIVKTENLKIRMDMSSLDDNVRRLCKHTGVEFRSKSTGASDDV